MKYLYSCSLSSGSDVIRLFAKCASNRTRQGKLCTPARAHAKTRSVFTHVYMLTSLPEDGEQEYKIPQYWYLFDHHIALLGWCVEEDLVKQANKILNEISSTNSNLFSGFLYKFIIFVKINWRKYFVDQNQLFS